MLYCSVFFKNIPTITHQKRYVYKATIRGPIKATEVMSRLGGITTVVVRREIKSQARLKVRGQDVIIRPFNLIECNIVTLPLSQYQLWVLKIKARSLLNDRYDLNKWVDRQVRTGQDKMKCRCHVRWPSTSSNVDTKVPVAQIHIFNTKMDCIRVNNYIVISYRFVIEATNSVTMSTNKAQIIVMF